MRERSITLPVRDNDGRSNQGAIRRIRKEILSITGGFSETRIRGQWRDSDGTIYRDDSWRVTTLAEEEQDAAIVERIPVWCEWLGQICLLTTSQELTVGFVYATNQEMATVA